MPPEFSVIEHVEVDPLARFSFTQAIQPIPYSSIDQYTGIPIHTTSIDVNILFIIFSDDWWSPEATLKSVFHTYIL